MVSTAVALARKCSYGRAVAMFTASLFRREAVEAAAAVAMLFLWLLCRCSGEKLSKQQLQSNNIIKKLRAKEKETDTQLKTLREKGESQKTELEKLKKILDNKCDVEKQQAGARSPCVGFLQSYMSTSYITFSHKVVRR